MQIEITPNGFRLDGVGYKRVVETATGSCEGCAFEEDSENGCKLDFLTLENEALAEFSLIHGGQNCVRPLSIWVKISDVNGWKPDPVKSGQEIMDITRSLVG